MKFSTILRMAALVVFGAVLLSWAAALSAADPAGDSPMNGIPVGVGSSETCASQTLAPGAQVWLKVPYHSGMDLEMHVKSGAGVSFDVYTPSQVANWPTLSPQPIGRLQPDPNEPGYTDTWKGKLGLGTQSGFYYVLVTNTNQFQVTFSFCTSQAEQFSFGPPAPGGPPATTSSSSSSSSSSLSESSSSSSSSLSESSSSSSSSSSQSTQD